LKTKKYINHRRKGNIIRFILPVIIIITVVIISIIIIKTKPKSKKKIPEKMKILVKAQHIKKTTDNIIIASQGTIIPAKEIILFPKVSGTIINIFDNFSEGEIVLKDTPLIKIEPEDYEIILNQEKAKLKKAQSALELENGRQAVAKQEWEIMQSYIKTKEISNFLPLRVPQLKQFSADLETAKAAVAKAELNLKRTEVLMPFDGIITHKFVDIGSQISTQSKLANIVYSKEFWIEVLIPYEKLKWLNLPEINNKTGSKVTIFDTNSKQILGTGEIIKLLKEIETKGRMASIIVSIKDPLKIKNQKIPILLNSYVSIEIEGKEAKDIFKIPRSTLRENDTIWEVDENNKLAITKVQVIWKDINYVCIKLNKKNINLIMTNLSLPVPGIPVKIINSNKTDDKKSNSHASPKKYIKKAEDTKSQLELKKLNKKNKLDVD